MTPQDFAQSNQNIDGRVPVQGAGLEPLPAYRGVTNGTELFISCWQPTAEELSEINRTGKVWLLVFGQTHPIVHLAGECPFGPPVISHESTNGDG
jgi:hypothetical protein